MHCLFVLFLSFFLSFSCLLWRTEAVCMAETAFEPTRDFLTKPTDDVIVWRSTLAFIDSGVLILTMETNCRLYIMLVTFMILLFVLFRLVYDHWLHEASNSADLTLFLHFVAWECGFCCHLSWWTGPCVIVFQTCCQHFAWIISFFEFSNCGPSLALVVVLVLVVFVVTMMINCWESQTLIVNVWCLVDFFLWIKEQAMQFILTYSYVELFWVCFVVSVCQ